MVRRMQDSERDRICSLSGISRSGGGSGFSIPSSKPFAGIASRDSPVEVHSLLQVARTLGASRTLSATVSYFPKFEVSSPLKKQHPKFGSHHLKIPPCCCNTDFFVTYNQIVLAQISKRQCLTFACYLCLIEDQLSY